MTSKEAESFPSCDSEQGNNFAMFPVATIVFTTIWELSPFFLSSSSEKKLFLQNLLNIIENTKFQENKLTFVHSFIHSLL